MISPFSFLPISMANFDFPVPVAPKITTIGKRLTALTTPLGAAIIIVDVMILEIPLFRRSTYNLLKEDGSMCFPALIQDLVALRIVKNHYFPL